MGNLLTLPSPNKVLLNLDIKPQFPRIMALSGQLGPLVMHLVSRLQDQRCNGSAFIYSCRAYFCFSCRPNADHPVGRDIPSTLVIAEMWSIDQRAAHRIVLTVILAR